MSGTEWTEPGQGAIQRARADHYERALIVLKETLAARKTRVNMADGTSAVTFISLALHCAPLTTEDLKRIAEAK